MASEYKLIDTNDSIDFGSQNGEPFKWIFLLDITYLVWLIEETDVCFVNLNLFFTFGKPLIIDEKKLTNEETNYLLNLSKNIGKNIHNMYVFKLNWTFAKRVFS